jgi:hypothetical protein
MLLLIFPPVLMADNRPYVVLALFALWNGGLSDGHLPEVIDPLSDVGLTGAHKVGVVHARVPHVRFEHKLTGIGSIASGA